MPFRPSATGHYQNLAITQELMTISCMSTWNLVLGTHELNIICFRWSCIFTWYPSIMFAILFFLLSLPRSRIKHPTLNLRLMFTFLRWRGISDFGPSSRPNDGLGNDMWVIVESILSTSVIISAALRMNRSASDDIKFFLHFKFFFFNWVWRCFFFF